MYSESMAASLTTILSLAEQTRKNPRFRPVLHDALLERYTKYERLIDLAHRDAEAFGTTQIIGLSPSILAATDDVDRAARVMDEIWRVNSPRPASRLPAGVVRIIAVEPPPWQEPGRYEYVTKLDVRRPGAQVPYTSIFHTNNTLEAARHYLVRLRERGVAGQYQHVRQFRIPTRGTPAF